MKKMILMAVASFLFFSACQKNETGYNKHSLIKMEKTGCFGNCPVYTIQIEGTGFAKLQGDKHLDKLGAHEKQLTKEERDQLFTAFLKADLWSFEDEYTADVTDLPTTYLTFRNLGKTMTIKDYYGAPQKLIDLEEMVASIVNSPGWKEVEGIAAVSYMNDPDPVRRGEYLVNIAGCHDCHSPKKMTEKGPVLDENLLLSGHPSVLPVAKFDPAIFQEWVLFNHHNTAAAGPWGLSFAANLTSDETGIGYWTEEQFIYALRNGVLKGLEGSRPLLPPMPWPNTAQMTDEDLKAIFAYLKTTKPVKNVVPAPIPPAGLSMK